MGRVNWIQPSEEFTGANGFRGVNPATGSGCLLPTARVEERRTKSRWRSKTRREILCAAFSSKADEEVQQIGGAPRPDPLLPKGKGLNRFVWDMRYATMPGVPGVRIEGSYAAHKAPPGKYMITLKWATQTLSTEAEILANPLYPTNAATYTRIRPDDVGHGNRTDYDAPHDQ